MGKNRFVVGAIVLFSAIALVIPSTEALAGQGRGNAKGQGQKAAKADDKRDKNEQKADKKEQKADKKDNKAAAVVVVDRDGHLRAIREYAHGGSLPPGLAKRKSLPPGLRKQLRERGALPPGLQKRLVPVPAPLIARLPPVPPYYSRYFAGDDFIVIDTRTNRIVLIVLDVWR
jgi:hypothetical protein